MSEQTRVSKCRYCGGEPSIFDVSNNRHVLSGIACANIDCARGFVLPVGRGEDACAIWTEANKQVDKGGLVPLKPWHHATLRSSIGCVTVARSFLRCMARQFSNQLLDLDLIFAIVFYDVDGPLRDNSLHTIVKVREDYEQGDIDAAYDNVRDFAAKLRCKLVRYAEMGGERPATRSEDA